MPRMRHAPTRFARGVGRWTAGTSSSVLWCGGTQDEHFGPRAGPPAFPPIACRACGMLPLASLAESGGGRLVPHRRFSGAGVHRMSISALAMVHQHSLLSHAAHAACSHSLRSRSREVDGWYLIVGSLVRGYTG